MQIKMQEFYMVMFLLLCIFSYVPYSSTHDSSCYQRRFGCVNYVISKVYSHGITFFRFFLPLKYFVLFVQEEIILFINLYRYTQQSQQNIQYICHQYFITLTINTKQCAQKRVFYTLQVVNFFCLSSSYKPFALFFQFKKFRRDFQFATALWMPKETKNYTFDIMS